MKAMLQRGGDNPWEVNYSQEAAKAIEGTDSDSNLNDKSKRSGEEEKGFTDRAKRVTF
jgi:hypothetical protein